MKGGTENRKKIIALSLAGAALCCLAYFLYSQFGGSSDSTPSRVKKIAWRTPSIVAATGEGGLLWTAKKPAILKQYIF